jgi:hypothetical protein
VTLVLKDVRWSQWAVIDDVEVAPRPWEAIGAERRDQEVVRVEDAPWRWIHRRKQGAVDIREDTPPGKPPMVVSGSITRPKR